MSYDMRNAAFEIRDENGLTYEPWGLGDMIGYRVWHPNGVVRYLYFRPSTDDTQGISNVFVYYGPEGDAGVDEPWHHYTIEQETDDEK